MPIVIRVPTPLRACCGGSSELQLSATTVRNALEQLERSYPALYGSICDETGAVRRHLHLFVNNELCRDRGGLDAVFAAGDTLFIMQAVSGG